MATGSFIQVTNGGGPKVSTGPLYTENANAVQDQKVILGEGYLAHYAVDSNGGIAPPNAASKAWFAINAGASLNLRIRRLLINQATISATTAGSITLGVYRTTTAPTGGTAQTPRLFDNSDAAAGATAASVSNATFTADPALGTRLALFSLPVFLTYPFNLEPFELRWGDQPGTKPIIVPAGTANGITLFLIAANAYAGTPTFNISFEFTETAF